MLCLELKFGASAKCAKNKYLLSLRRDKENDRYRDPRITLVGINDFIPEEQRKESQLAAWFVKETTPRTCAPTMHGGGGAIIDMPGIENILLIVDYLNML